MPASTRPSPGAGRLDGGLLRWLLLAGYPLLYALGYLSKSVAGSAAIWPAHALTFAAFMLLAPRRWPVVVLGVAAWEMASRPAFYWLATQDGTSAALSAVFACANVLTPLGPAAMARALRLFRLGEPFPLVVSPLWLVALFFGSLPGALLGAAASAHVNGMPVSIADAGLWQLAFVLTLSTFGPMVFGLLLGFEEPTSRPAKAWEGWVVALMMAAFFVCFSFLPWDDPLVQPMLFAVPLSWLALRFSRKATVIAVVVVACGVVFLAGYGVGIYSGFSTAAGWRNVVISIDVFLVIACGGALLINLLTLKQRMLLDQLAREHTALRDYARALGQAEETARRKTAADLHDGIGQVLAGQSMTLAAMRAHAREAPLAAMLEEAVQASREAQEGLRVMIQDLSPPGLDQASVEEMLAWLAEFFGSRYGFRVTWRVHGASEPPRERLRLIYRCVRELLMNARKHSQRPSADVEIEVSPRAVRIAVVDQGIGFDAWGSDPFASGFGLAQLKERIQDAGGALELETMVGAGCRATVKLPCPAQAAAAPQPPRLEPGLGAANPSGP